MPAKPETTLTIFIIVAAVFGVTAIIWGSGAGNYVMLAAGVVATAGALSFAVAMTRRRMTRR
ncbi:hypothetical protein ACFWDQ_40685 [Streptomyces sp. NPDC060053]|uniref:hypothetical protein n=1 Tax=Streptomyces sp. NPDC060053 TaxID=3347047 RepID=UPI0036C2ECD1